MLRRKLSAGLLRAGGSSTSTAATGLPASPIQQQVAGLASAVLLNTQHNWGRETVVTLKQELRKRGLSQNGNKYICAGCRSSSTADVIVRNILVDRLNSADISVSLPPVPSIPALSIRSIPSSPSRARAITTSTPRSLPPKTAANPDPPVKPVETVQTDHVSSIGPVVLSQRTEAAKVAPVEPELVTVAPGLPESKAATKGFKERSPVNMPIPPPEFQVEQVIVRFFQF